MSWASARGAIFPASGAYASIQPDIGSLDDGLPLFGSGFEQGAGLGTYACHRLQPLRAKPCLQTGRLQLYALMLVVAVGLFALSLWIFT